MNQLSISELLLKFIGLTENEADNIRIIPDSSIYKVGQSQLDRSMKGVTYAFSQSQAFFVIFDADFDGKAVVQKTFWNNETESLYQMMKENAVPGKHYPGSDGFYVYSPTKGYVLIEKQNLQGRMCISASCNCIL